MKKQGHLNNYPTIVTEISDFWLGLILTLIIISLALIYLVKPEKNGGA